MHVAEGKKNSFVTQVQPVSSFPGLRADYYRLTFALALAELAAAVLPHEQPLPEAFTLMVQSLKYLETHDKPLVALIWAEAKMMEQAGFFPELLTCVQTGEKVFEAMPFLSPHAGGYVCVERAVRFTDRFQARAEVLYGLNALVELDEPPANLKYADETLVALLPFWRNIADKPLPANEAMVAGIRHGV
jgi:DNA repair protein RecO